MKTVELIKIIVISSLLVLLSNQLLYSQKWTVIPKTATGFNSVMNTCVDDGEGKLWIGSFNKGIYSFDGVNWIKTSDSTPSGIYDMMIANGDIWAAANGGLIRIPKFEYSNIQTLKYSDTISNFFWSVAYDSTGTVWVGSGDVTKTLLLAYKNGEWKEIDCKSLGEQSYIPAIVVDSKNRKWFISDAGLSMYNDTTFVTYNHTNSNLPITSFTHLEIDSKGNLWIGTVGFGLYKFDGTTFTNFSHINSVLPLGVIFSAIAFDKNDIVWVGTESMGIFTFDGTNWAQFNLANSGVQSTMIRAITVASKDRKIFATIDQGIIIFDGNITSVGSEEFEDGIYPNPVFSQISVKTQSKESALIRIFNQLGEDVTSICSGIENVDANGIVTINVSKLAPAVYFLHNGNTVEKFIKIQ